MLRRNCIAGGGEHKKDARLITPARRLGTENSVPDQVAFGAVLPIGSEWSFARNRNGYAQYVIFGDSLNVKGFEPGNVTCPCTAIKSVFLSAWVDPNQYPLRSFSVSLLYTEIAYLSNSIHRFLTNLCLPAFSVYYRLHRLIETV